MCACTYGSAQRTVSTGAFQRCELVREHLANDAGSHVYTHVYTHVRAHVYAHVYKHVYAHVLNKVFRSTKFWLNTTTILLTCGAYISVRSSMVGQHPETCPLARNCSVVPFLPLPECISACLQDPTRVGCNQSCGAGKDVDSGLGALRDPFCLNCSLSAVPEWCKTCSAGSLVPKRDCIDCKANPSLVWCEGRSWLWVGMVIAQFSILMTIGLVDAAPLGCRTLLIRWLSTGTAVIGTMGFVQWLLELKELYSECKVFEFQFAGHQVYNTYETVLDGWTFMTIFALQAAYIGWLQPGMAAWIFNRPPKR